MLLWAPRCGWAAHRSCLPWPGCLQEIASALAYLHSRNILHGDLTPGNVLLCTAPPLSRRHPRDPRGFQAKVTWWGPGWG